MASLMIKQFVPQEVCLKCQGCCRYNQIDSVWAPCLLDKEIQDLLNRKIPPASISIDRRIVPILNPGKDNFICAFLDPQDNQCKIYDFRPFECQLYPFLINLRNKKVILTVDLNCQYIKENLKSQKMKNYIEYLTSFLNSPARIRMLRDNPHILQAYEEVLDIVELKIPDEAE